ALPTALELETAIAAAEDEVHTAQPHFRAALGEGAAALPWSADAGLHALATLAGVPDGAERLLDLPSVERLFNRLARVVEGLPAAHEGLPEDAAFAARLVVLRELMHHLPLAAIRLRATAP